VVAVYVPAGHSTAASGVGHFELRGQGWHRVEPGVLTKKPAAHVVQAAWPVAENWPAGQGNAVPLLHCEPAGQI
jgi:hypothetical protein